MLRQITGQISSQIDVKDNISFMDKMKNEFIPTLRLMIEKESKHLDWLKSKDQSNKEIYMFTIRSACVLKHLEERLEDYIKYTTKQKID